MSFAEQDAIVSGIGISRIGRRTGIPGLELTLESARQAIADAGLTPADIDGITTLGDTPAGEVAKALGITSVFRGGGFDNGGLLTPVMSAALAVGEKRARHVLVYRTVQMMGGTVAPPPKEKKDGPKTPPPFNEITADFGPLMAANAYSAANWLALHCRRHMDLYGTTREHLGAMAINSRANAALNPLATYKDPITMEDYLAARLVSTPFGLLDCDVPVDGSIAVVVSHREYAADAPHLAVSIAAMGGATGAGGWYRRADFPRMAMHDAAEQLWSRTDLRPADLDVAQVYDGFTFLTLAWLEALGICGEGEGGAFVDGGSRIARNGVLPLNTYGGQLSAGRMHGYWVLHEAVLQLRGQAGERQVAAHRSGGRPEVAVVTAGGGPIAGALLLTC